MADTADIHPTDGRRRREKGPPSRLALPRLERVSDTERGHSEDSAGEKEAKRQRSNPETPVSTPRRMPYDYDAVMGITRVGTREAEGFDEDLDSTEYHDVNDTTEETTRKEETEADTSVQKSMGFQGGYGSSSLKECIELLNTTTRIAPAPLDSGVGNSADPQQKVDGCCWQGKQIESLRLRKIILFVQKNIILGSLKRGLNLQEGEGAPEQGPNL